MRPMFAIENCFVISLIMLPLSIPCGVLIWTSLGIGLNLMNISIYIRDLVRGVILLLALIFNILVQRSVQVED